MRAGGARSRDPDFGARLAAPDGREGGVVADSRINRRLVGSPMTPRDAVAAPRRDAGTEMLEREPFLAMLGEALDAARTSGRIVVVSGEAGIGKTSLVDRFAAERSGRARVLWGA